MGRRKRISIYVLYSEVMPYTISVWNVLQSKFRCVLTVVYWDKGKLTPYLFSSGGIASYPRSSETLSSMSLRLSSLAPDLLYISGRMDRDYLKVARKAIRRGIPVVMGSDKRWHGNHRDFIAAMLRALLYRPFFTHAWVPGVQQYEYAKRVGFKNDAILFDLYAGNIDLFNSFFNKRRGIGPQEDILFVGRLNEVKGVLPFIDVLVKLKNNGVFCGNLWLYGNGPLEDEIPAHDWIIRKGFAEQADMEEGILSSCLFCLPSLEEPWGVVLHEMAAAGLPICCSKACGASTAFVKQGYNGFVFNTGDWKELELKLELILTSSVEVQTLMGERSHLLAQTITPETSALSLLRILEDDARLMKVRCETAD